MCPSKLNTQGKPMTPQTLLKHLDEIYWPFLSANPAAIELLKAHRGKIDWDWFCYIFNRLDFLPRSSPKLGIQQGRSEIGEKRLFPHLQRKRLYLVVWRSFERSCTQLQPTDSNAKRYASSSATINL